MDVTIVSLAGEVSFADGSVTNILLLRAPSGRMLRAIVSDESARLLYDDLASMRVGAPHALAQTSAPIVRVPSTRQEEQQEEQGDGTDPPGAVVFGGNGGMEEEEESSAAAWPGPQTAVEEEPAPAAPAQQVWTDPDAQMRAYQQQQKAQKAQMGRGGSRPGRTVPKDDRGNPVSRTNGVDPAGLVGGGSTQDEDGVGQV